MPRTSNFHTSHTIFQDHGYDNQNFLNRIQGLDSYGNQYRAMIQDSPRQVMNLKTRKHLDLASHGKDPINPIPHPCSTLLVVAIGKYGSEEAQAYQPIPLSEVTKLSHRNVVSKRPPPRFS